MSDDVLWAALALVLVIEGLMPAIHPKGWRRMFERIMQLDDQQVRTAGLLSMVLGLILLWISQSGGA
ncbi:MAG: hypothetical protein RI907_1732 [Pseudomonadota bacterium]|jgi:uncharacterized protein YjeT (DUF2065 family)